MFIHLKKRHREGGLFFVCEAFVGRGDHSTSAYAATLGARNESELAIDGQRDA